MIECFAAFEDAEKAYKDVRQELDRMLGACSDSILPLVQRLKSSNSLAENDYDGHLEFYTQLIRAEAAASALGQRDLLDRFDNCGDIVEKRLQYAATRWWREDLEAKKTRGRNFGFEDLKQFVQDNIRILARRRNLRSSPPAKINATDANSAAPQSRGGGGGRRQRQHQSTAAQNPPANPPQPQQQHVAINAQSFAPMTTYSAPPSGFMIDPNTSTATSYMQGTHLQS